MDNLKVIVITLLITIVSNSISASSLNSQVYFKKIRDYGKHDLYVFLNSNVY